MYRVQCNECKKGFLDFTDDGLLTCNLCEAKYVMIMCEKGKNINDKKEKGSEL